MWELNKELIEDKVKNKGLVLGSEICFLETVDSTNRACKEMGRAGGKHGLAVISREQTAGRGRLGRGWTSNKNEGIYMSLLLRPESLLITKASLITLLTAMAVNNSIRKLTGLEAVIKWPNDIVVNGKKVCGILVEMSSRQNTLEYVVVGIGVNVNGETFPEELIEKATSLKKEKGSTVNMNDLAAAILEEFQNYFTKFIDNAGEFTFVEEYNAALINRNKTVRIIEGERECTGISLGINASGALLVKAGNNEILEIVSGEVQVRGLYGYV